MRELKTCWSHATPPVSLNLEHLCHLSPTLDLLSPHVLMHSGHPDVRYSWNATLELHDHLFLCLCFKNLSRSLAGANSQRSKRTHRSISSSSARTSETTSVNNAQFLLGTLWKDCRKQSKMCWIMHFVQGCPQRGCWWLALISGYRIPSLQQPSFCDGTASQCVTVSFDLCHVRRKGSQLRWWSEYLSKFPEPIDVIELNTSILFELYSEIFTHRDCNLTLD